MRNSGCLVVSLGRSSIIKYHRSPKVYLDWNETNLADWREGSSSERYNSLHSSGLASLEFCIIIIKCNNISKLNCKTDKSSRYVSRV
jgi:hypothetical protein